MPPYSRNGHWYGSFYATDPATGIRKQYRPSLGSTIRNLREAKEAERQRQAAIEARPAPIAEGVTMDAAPQSGRSAFPPAAFSGFAKVWLDIYVRVSRKPSVARRYESIIRVWLVPFFKDRQLATLTALDIEQLKAWCCRQAHPVGAHPRSGSLPVPRARPTRRGGMARP